jgi:hypothetical protein
LDIPQNYVDVPALDGERADVAKRCVAFPTSRLPGSWSRPLLNVRLDPAEMPEKFVRRWKLLQ